MPTFKIVLNVTRRQTLTYEIHADSEEDAREIVDLGDIANYEPEDVKTHQDDVDIVTLEALS